MFLSSLAPLKFVPKMSASFASPWLVPFTSVTRPPAPLVSCYILEHLSNWCQIDFLEEPLMCLSLLCHQVLCLMIWHLAMPFWALGIEKMPLPQALLVWRHVSLLSDQAFMQSRACLPYTLAHRICLSQLIEWSNNARWLNTLSIWGAFLNMGFRYNSDSPMIGTIIKSCGLHVVSWVCLSETSQKPS